MLVPFNKKCINGDDLEIKKILNSKKSNSEKLLNYKSKIDSIKKQIIEPILETKNNQIKEAKELSKSIKSVSVQTDNNIYPVNEEFINTIPRNPKKRKLETEYNKTSNLVPIKLLNSIDIQPSDTLKDTEQIQFHSLNPKIKYTRKQYKNWKPYN